MMRKMTDQEISSLLEEESDWSLEGGALVREWKFESFVEAMSFVNRVAAVAEEAGHHPDIDVRYSRVRLALVTHDAGGITDRDAEMAKRISLF
jgi:4a-hydroxytetrahydrobiopterin dehydratase